MKRTRTKPHEIAAIGVDRGGTWTRIAAIDARRRLLKAVRFRTGPLAVLPKKLRTVLARWPGGAAAPLVIATRGAFSRGQIKIFLTRALAGRLNLADVISDAEAAHFAFFGGEPGHLLIAGTGAVVFSGSAGGFRKTGGFNPPSGDPGSGRWLGRQYLKHLGRLSEAGPMGHGRCAAYAAKLLARAERGDKTCALMAAAAQHELAVILKAAAGTGRGDVRTGLAGGLMESDYFRAGFKRAAREALRGRKLVFTPAGANAAVAAARLALKRRARK